MLDNIECVVEINIVPQGTSRDQQVPKAIKVWKESLKAEKELRDSLKANMASFKNKPQEMAAHARRVVDAQLARGMSREATQRVARMADTMKTQADEPAFRSCANNENGMAMMASAACSGSQY